MKKMIVFLILSVFVTGVASAITVCAKSSTYVGILKKDVDGTSGESNVSDKIWRVVYNYDTLTGLAACNEITGTYGIPQTNLYTSSVDEGEQCWCKMEPVLAYDKEVGITSYWVFLNTYSDAPTCASSCADACMNAMKSNMAFRSAVFESVW